MVDGIREWAIEVPGDVGKISVAPIEAEDS